jgi:glutathione S-transferase
MGYSTWFVNMHTLFSMLRGQRDCRCADCVRVFFFMRSDSTQRVMLSLIENGADFEIKPVDLRKGEHKQPAHLARQPFGQIPALDDGGFIVYESRAIARYVNDTRGNKLVPADPKAKAIMEQWISLEQGTITPEASGIVGQRVFAPMFGGKCDDSKVAQHVEKIKQGLDIMDKHLSTNQFLAGNQFTLADAFFMPYFAMLLQTPEGTQLSSRPNIAAWWKRCSERPSWVKALSYNEFAKKE